MIVTFRTITQQTFKIEFEPSTKISDVKKKISDEKGESDFGVESQKLIYNGKILQDEQLLEEVNIDEKKFVVVMVSRKKAETPTTSATNVDEKKETTTAGDSSKADVKSSPEKRAEVAQPSANLEVPAEYADVVTMIQGMGYPRGEVIRALKASFYDADRCVEYLCTGIPENIEPAGVLEDAQDDEMDEEEDQGLDFLQNSPQFQQIRDLVRARPELLPQIVQQIAGSNPELMNAIRNNQQEFLQLINSNPTDVAGSVPPTHAPEAGGGGAAAGAGQPPGGMVTINVSENDRNAIQRLKALGFAEQLVIEAYFACDKNEDLAANYILARMDEIHDEINNPGGTD